MEIEPGSSTASPFNAEYRLGRISKYVKGGDWLDYGCADGGYTAGLLAIPAGTQIIRFLPALNLRRSEADEGLRIIETVVANLSS